MDPITIAFLVASLAAAASSAYMGKKASDAQAEAVEKNAAEQYSASSEQERQAGVQGAEKMSDRMRSAAQQLSMARVMAAEGAGGLRGRADNILASAAEDTSRIQAGVANVQSGIRQDMNAIRVAAEGQGAAIASQGQAIRTRFLTDVGTAAMGAYAGSVKRDSEIKTAKGFTADYSLTSGTNRIKFGSP